MSGISENIQIVRENIAAALQGGDRAVLLVAATKMNDAERVREAIAAGVDGCGENKVQEFLEKDALGAYDGCPKHFIGHLQKNKVKNVVGLAELIHSTDSIELMAAIDRQAKKLGIVQDILLEVNVGAESSKSGFAPAEIDAALAAAADFSGIRVRGLMAIPPICTSGAENLPYFKVLQQLFIDNCDKKYDNVRMDFMSMGMSGDYEAAIACGANMIRVGTAIFGQRNYAAPAD